MRRRRRRAIRTRSCASGSSGSARSSTATAPARPRRNGSANATITRISPRPIAAACPTTKLCPANRRSIRGRRRGTNLPARPDCDIGSTMDQAELQRTLAAAKRARQAGRPDEAERLLRAIVRPEGDQPGAPNALGMNSLAQGRHEDAAALFRRAIAADPQSPELWMNLARASDEKGNDEAQKQALEGALAIDQRHFMALVRLAELFERKGEEARAAERWSGAMAVAAMMEGPPPAPGAMMTHAGDYGARQRAGFAAAVDLGLAGARDGLDASQRRRFDACIDHVLGRRQIYANHCAGIHFPFLPADEFFERAHFSWLEEIEAKTDAIRAELETLLAEKAA